ncbi:hypothetical protein B0H13DRAFT_1870656 [Mycena leptocephala]|nr:hypothetical protein B0H13DRAFT_1870656 [Mycena leptocephala]
MGRRANHLTKDAKAAAKLSQVQKHYKTPRGQAARVRATKPKHHRKEGKHMPSVIPGLAAPNTEIQDLYNTPLPNHEPLFRDALRSADALDEGGLSLWKTEPPFAEDEDSMDPYSAGYLTYTHSLVLVMHGIRLREQNARNAEWRAEFLEKGWKVAMAELREEVRGLLQRWEIVTKLSREGFYHPYHDSREYTMLTHYRQWLARTIFSLYHLKFVQ